MMENVVPDESLAEWAGEQDRAPDGSVSASGMARLLRRHIRIMENTARSVAEFCEKSRLMPGEFEWLLDNRYLCQREGLEAYRALKRAGRLPRVGKTACAYRLARLLTRSGQGEITPARIGLFLEGAQRVRPLSEKELWLFTPMLRAAVMEQVAGACAEMDAIITAYRRPGGESPFSAEAAVFAARSAGTVPDAEAARRAEPAETAHRRLSEFVGNLITSLRTLSVTDLTETLREASAVERRLREDPAGAYPLMDEESRARCRQELSLIAKKLRIGEYEAVARVLALARKGEGERERHVGYYIHEKPLGENPSRLPGVIYFLCAALLTLAPAAACAAITGRWWVPLLLLLPLSTMAKHITDAAAARLVRPRPIPRLELAGGLPAEGKTLCVVSALLTDAQKGPEYAAKIEAYRYANRDAGRNLLFGLLCDLPDSPSPGRPGDEKIWGEAREAVAALNRKHGGGFYLFARDRRLNKSDGIYMGWERKRGAILELCRLLRGGESSLRVRAGDAAALSGVRYVLALDADTALTPGSARKLAGGMLHPLSKPAVDPVRRVVTRGRALIAPRMAVELEAAGKSVFSRVYAGQGGLDPYGGLAGEVYHDLFDEGSFSGKGIFDVDAFLQCLDGRFPENRILSHDLLEGAYLGAGFMGDAELSDGFPHRLSSWFDRSHRWIRGDWQAAAWILPRVKTDGGSEKNPLSALSRWKLFDNLRRSLSPVALFAAFAAGMVFPGKTFGVIFATAILTSLSGLLISLAQTAARRDFRRVRHHAPIITGVAAALAQTAAGILLLPYQAFVCLSAACTALFRVAVSKKRLLRWVTSAESDRFSAGVIPLFRKMFPAVAAGVLAACLAKGTGQWILGAMWALSPFLAYIVSLPDEREETVSGADRAFLLRQAALMWRYFDDLLTPEDHFLPPDNRQERPAAGVAHRTSPTNIGLSLLCALAAHDLGLCGRERALRLIDGTLATVESLPKWHGHIYNWYDTRTLEPLRPRCVSAVDSGNLCGCLIALREGLVEMGDAAAEDLAARAGAIADNMAFGPLYDRGRRLFYISYDMENDAPGGGYYDLLASEARQTSYIAVARGEVDKKHWERLGRALTGLGRYRGMASWTGTMFEYFMPHLLLPAYKDSMLRESLCFAVYAQRELAARRGGPWGVSESCFYAFDPALNYQYKAHGVPALAYKRGLGKDWVVSPYSSFLSLLTHPRQSVKNLRRLHALGMEGRYGLMEAADFTPARLTGADKKFEPIHCFMSHHVGMSLVAVCNALRGNIMQKRFMRDGPMGAFAGLLQERVPVGAGTVRPAGREVPEKPRRADGGGLRREIAGVKPYEPQATLLTNSSYTLLATDTGLTLSRCGGLTLTRFDAACRGGAGGMRFFFRGPDGVPTSLLCAPGMAEPERYSAVLEGGSVSWRYSGASVACKITARVPGDENGETRTVTIENRSGEAVAGELAAYFEPVLQAGADFAAHPAFSKLFLETEIENGAVVVRRRPRGGREEVFLCFCCDEPGVRYDTSRERALGRGGEQNIAAALSRPPQNTQGAVLDPCVLARVPLRVPRGGSVTVRFALTCAASREDALSSARRLCRQSSSGGESRPDAAARLLGLTESECAEAAGWLARMVFPAAGPDGSRAGGLRLGAPGLWGLGISGDLPIILAPAADGVKLESVGRTVRQHRWLAMCGFSSDLVILTREGADYRRPARTFIMETLKAAHAENRLGGKGGVHAVDLSGIDPDTEDLLYALARVVAGGAAPAGAPMPESGALPPPPVEEGARDGVRFGWEPGGEFCFETGGGLPPLGWSHILANRAFGTLVTETGAGYLFARNARENKLTPWTNDPLATGGGVSVRVRAGGCETSLFADGRVPCRVVYGFGTAVFEKTFAGITVKTTLFVPPGRAALVMDMELFGARGAELIWESALCMGPSPDWGRTVLVRQDGSGPVLAENPMNTAYSPQTFILAASEGIERLPAPPGTVSVKIPFSRGDGGPRLTLAAGCAQNAPGLRLVEALADAAEAAVALEDTKKYWQKLARPRLFDTGEQALDRYMNGWALYQVVACRLFARTSLYQCGGAYGFRDQLQDACAALYSDPALTRTQILRACARQYEEGDVMHWWHPSRHGPGESDKGVRTRCSDDLLWLPYAFCLYSGHTGDAGLADLEMPFISSQPLAPGAHDRYESAAVTKSRAGVYEHCCRAADLAIHRGVGPRGLLLMGACDWNDGFSLVGDGGAGESVWLTWFAAHVLEMFIPVCEARGDMGRAGHYRAWADELIRAAAAAWDGEWFLRGTYDDGSALGSSADECCRIDSIAQSFSALFGGRVPPERVNSALGAALRELVDKESRVVKLFTPAFTASCAANPGYIKGYLPGVRENGGQYTHAAVWLAMGLLESGRPDDCLEVLKLLLPETHDPAVYKAEPHVLAADVYSHPAHLGRGGWTHYTGAAAWYYRVARAWAEKTGREG